jgi:hypothetical protein
MNMADIELVIKIPEYIYKLCQGHEDIVYKYIANGTQLPKGHGDVIDRNELKKHKYHDNNRYENAVSIAQVDWQPVIIEADKESEE